MLYDRRSNYVGPHCEGTRRFIVAEELDTQADAGRGPQRGRFAKPVPGTRASGPLACRQSVVYQTHTIQHVPMDESLEGTRTEKCHASVRSNGVPPHCIQILVMNETSSSVTVPPARQGACFDSARRGSTPEAISKNFLALARRRVREIGRKLRKRTLASAGRGQRARLRRGRNFVDSSIPRGSTEPTNGGRVCQPGLSVANFFANGRKRLTEQNFPSPLAWAFGSGIICSETNTPHWVQRAGFGQPFIACLLYTSPSPRDGLLSRMPSSA